MFDGDVQIDISSMRNMQVEESSVKEQNARNRCQDDSPTRKDAPMVLENIEDTPQLWLKKAENDLLSCSLFGNREHESKPAKKMVFEKVGTCICTRATPFRLSSIPRTLLF